MSPSPSEPGSPGRKQRLFLRIEALARRRYFFVFAAGLLAVGLGGLLGSKLKLETDVLDLIPEGNRKVDAFRRCLTDFGSIDYLLVLMEAGDGGSTSDLEDFADVFAEKLQVREDLVESIEYRFQPDPRFLDLFSKNALLFVPPGELPAIAGRLTDDAIAHQVRENRMALVSPAGSLAEQLVVQDPLGLMPLMVGRLLSHRGSLKLDLSSGYYLSEDGKSLIALVKPRKPSMD